MNFYLLKTEFTFPEFKRDIVSDPNNKEEVAAKFANLSYSNEENYLTQIRKYEVASHLGGGVIVNGWTITFMHLFETESERNEYKNIGLEIKEINESLRDFTLYPAIITESECSIEQWIELSDNFIGQISPF